MIPLRSLTWWDRSLRLYTTLLRDPEGNQVGVAGYGPTPGSSRVDAKTQPFPEGYEIVDKPYAGGVAK